MEFVRSCFDGFWRFFPKRLDVLTPGRYVFIPDSRPHLDFYHLFGSAHWKKGDADPDPSEPLMGHDPELAEDYFLGGPPPGELPPVLVGDRSSFAAGASFPFAPPVMLRDGMDERCFIGPADRLLDTFLDVAIDNCAWLRIQCRILELVGLGQWGMVRDALKLIFGQETELIQAPGVGLFPPFALMKGKRCNIIFCFGTNTANQLATQFWQGRNGPTNHGAWSSLPLWMQHASNVVNAFNANNMNANKPTLCCGHSYGAAVASLFYYIIKRGEAGRITKLTAFGCPKPGDERLLNFINLNEDYVAVHNTPDMVPQIPPSGLLRVQVQAVFPFLPDEWFRGWSPFHRYLKMFPGQPFEYGPYFDATFQQYRDFIIWAMQQGGQSPLTAHFAANYSAQIQRRCPTVESPFIAEVYQMLALVNGPDFGGIGGAGQGFRPPMLPGRVVMGGHGVLGGGGGLGGGVGFVLGGGGLLGGPAGIGSEAGVVLGGAGELAPPGPGNSCATATDATLGTDYTFTVSSGQEHWFTWPISDFTQYHARLTVNSGSDPQWWIKTNTCGSLIDQWNFTGSNCGSFTVAFQPNGYVRIVGPAIGSCNYTLNIDLGPC